MNVSRAKWSRNRPPSCLISWSVFRETVMNSWAIGSKTPRSSSNVTETCFRISIKDMFLSIRKQSIFWSTHSAIGPLTKNNKLRSRCKARVSRLAWLLQVRFTISLEWARAHRQSRHASAQWSHNYNKQRSHPPFQTCQQFMAHRVRWPKFIRIAQSKSETVSTGTLRVSRTWNETRMSWVRPL